ncbi:MAG: FAD-binding protein [Clostridiales bacterium]|nr:FAD-binding protein [Clostridiales bacterium]
MQIRGASVRALAFNTVVVGTGAAGYNAACRLHGCGQRDIAIVTEAVGAGTSRNAGSDKQTYYKLTLAGGEPDSVREMAETLFAGQCVDGDIALCEAALSAQSFMRLVELGVPFPRNRHGEFVGYRTDHDTRRRATSAGPYTSRLMTERLQADADARGIPVFDGMQAVRILVEDGAHRGLLCYCAASRGFALFFSRNLVLATGGPAGMYADSAYPEGHFGATGIALEAGAAGRNLTEWQYGLASVAPRWNVSGSYMQALPRIFSSGGDGNGDGSGNGSGRRGFGGNGNSRGDGASGGFGGGNRGDGASGGFGNIGNNSASGTDGAHGSVGAGGDSADEREFLRGYFPDSGALLDNVFMKGYHWPFDAAKAAGGSSAIDILVHMERAKGRRVFLDYRRNPGGGIDFSSLGDEARAYLEKAGACFGSPLDRLLRLNSPAVDFFRDKGVDLAAEPLEIALCAQHNNGGLAVDCHWQTSVEGIFAVGEAAASHGVYRPGGSALNAGQAGSARAAQHIAARLGGRARAATLSGAALAQAEEIIDLAAAALRNRGPGASRSAGGAARALWARAARRMSRAGGPIRDAGLIAEAISDAKAELASLARAASASGACELGEVFRLRDILICQIAYLSAMSDYAKAGGKSRGSAIYAAPDGGEKGEGGEGSEGGEGGKAFCRLPGGLAFELDGGGLGGRVQEGWLAGGEPVFAWRDVRPIPDGDDFFENVWREYRESGGAYDA